MTQLTPPNPEAHSAVLAEVAARASSSGVFASVEVSGGVLRCAAKAAAAAAHYAVWADGKGLWVGLQTADRWLSQSIEQDLVHTGDKLDELLEEELIDLGYAGPRLPVEHFRSEEKLFTFRSPLPAGGSPELCLLVLLSYEACFRRLGDMEGGGDE